MSVQQQQASPRRVLRPLRPLQDFLRTEAAAGMLLLVMVPIALVWANGPFSDSYESFWTTNLSFAFNDHEFTLDLRHWVNDGMMALFFYVVALEIKRELIDGHLQDKRKAMTPALAALGGMLVPVCIYVVFNLGGELGGWGVPMATDIAIVLGILSLLGDRIPPGLKTFLLTLAIVDDVGAIAVIAVFYSEHAINWPAIGIAVAVFALVYLARRFGIRHPSVYVLLAIAAWSATFESGIHATLAGVALALLTSGRPLRDSDYVDAESLADVSTYEAASETATIARETISPVEWLQHVLHPWSSYFVLPVFALANAGIVISSKSLEDASSSPVAIGVALGLLLGKPIGICLFTWFAVRAMGGRLPDSVGVREVMAGSVLAGIGFTVSLFVADLAFADAEHISEAKAGVLFASFVAGCLGYATLRAVLKPKRSDQNGVS